VTRGSIWVPCENVGGLNPLNCHATLLVDFHRAQPAAAQLLFNGRRFTLFRCPCRGVTRVLFKNDHVREFIGNVERHTAILGPTFGCLVT
jgi:hypothetical protein